MSTSDGGRSAVGEINSSDKADDDDERLRSRLGKFTIDNEMTDMEASANHRYAI